MSYVVLARRYRPQTLDQVIGQEHITRTLKNAITENRVAHAYLFSGPRGVGKTTTARILAKALNCKNGPTNEPCGKCSNCTEIAAGTNIDVQEIDGASNRGIDEIRALRDNVKFAPAGSKFKIYIIDEAHQITDAAFNALLKTLEEPPSHVVFILATTEPQKIPVTILSRCQRYRFRLISAKEIAATMSKILDTEGFQIDPSALQMVTAAAGGSLRDALSLLDQAVSSASGKVTSADIQNLLGFLPKELIVSMTEALAKNDEGKILALTREVTEQGYNLIQFARDLRDHLRNILLIAVNPDVLETPDEEKKLLEKQKPFFTSSWLIRSGHLLSKALDEMRWADQPRLLLELYLLKLAQPYAGVNELVERLERLEKNMPFEPEEPRMPVRAPAPAAKPVHYTPAPEKVTEQAPKPAPKVSEPVQMEAAPAAADDAPAPVSGDIASVWAATVAEMQRTKPIIGNVLAQAGFEGLSGSSVMLLVANAFQLEGIKRNQALIEENLAKKYGRSLNVRVTIGEVKNAAGASATEEIIVNEEAEEAAPAPVYQVQGELMDPKKDLPPGIDKIMNKFPGKITKKK